MKVFDLTDGVERESGEMWDKLKERANIGRNEWHSKASAYTNRILSPENNLSAVTKGKRSMPLHDIVPMLKALNLDESYFNHYVREFLKAYLPAELTTFFNSPNDSSETLLLRNSATRVTAAMNELRAENDYLTTLKWGRQEKDSTILCRNELSDAIYHNSFQEFETREELWKNISFGYYQLLKYRAQNVLKQKECFFQLIFPEDWKNKLFNELNSSISQLSESSALSSTACWKENCLQFRPLRAILPHLYKEWCLHHPDIASKYTEAWKKIPLKYTNQGGGNEQLAKEYISDYFKKNNWSEYLDTSLNNIVTFSRFLDSYILEIYKDKPTIPMELNPFNDFYLLYTAEFKFFSDLANYHRQCKHNEITLENYCGFGFPRAKKANNIFKDVAEMVLLAKYKIRPADLMSQLKALDFSPKQASKIFKFIADIDCAKTETIVRDMRRRKFINLNKLLYSLPIKRQKMYQKRLRIIFQKLTKNEIDFDDLPVELKKFSSVLLKENFDHYTTKIEDRPNS